MATLTLVLVTAGGVVAGRALATRTVEGRVHVGEAIVSIETSDWTYGGSLDGLPWTDVSGSFHDRGRPDCLTPARDGTTVRFATTDVAVDGVGWRPILWVDCRGFSVHG